MAVRRRPKAKPAPPLPAENDPTVERQHHDDFTTIPAPRFTDELVGRDKLVTTRRRVPPLTRMEAGDDPWLDRRGAAALEHYTVLIERAGYDAGSKGCLATASGGGSGYDNVLDMRYESRRRLAAAANAIAAVDQIALLFVNAMFAPTNEATISVLAKHMLAGGLIEAKVRVRVAAEACALHFHRL